MSFLRKLILAVGLPLTMAASSSGVAQDGTRTASVTITEIMTLDEIKSRPDLYKDKIILHYDNNIKGVDADVLALSGRGFDVISIPAGNTGCGVRLILSGVTGKKMCFTQSNLYRGEVGGIAIALFPKVQERQVQDTVAAPSVEDKTHSNRYK